jgi:hypothetical protein
MSTEIQAAPKRSFMVKNLMPGLSEVGKIKIGVKGREITSRGGATFQPPQKLDHFLVTTLMRGSDGNYLIDREVHEKYGEKPRSLPVRLVYNDPELNFQSRYVCFKGKNLWCSGDGEQACRREPSGNMQERTCPCELQNPEYAGTADRPKCKINGTLSVMIDGVAKVGGVWKLRTTSYNSVVGITSSLSLISTLTGGIVAGLPFDLTLRPKTAIVPTSGQSTLVWVVGIEYRGTVEDLQSIAYERAKNQALYYAKMDQIEHQARKLIVHDPSIIDVTEAKDIIEEFYPEQAALELQRGQGGNAPNSTGNQTQGQAQPGPESGTDGGNITEPAVNAEPANAGTEATPADKKPDDLLNGAICHALFHLDGARDRWAERIAKGMEDIHLANAIRKEFGEGGNTDNFGWYSEKPSIMVDGKTVLSGQFLVEKVREILSIPYPQKTTNGNGGTGQQDAKPGFRRRANNFNVDPDKFDGASKLQTCGVTPDQLLVIREHARTVAGASDVIKQTMADLGIAELSFLRPAEASKLIASLRELKNEVDAPAGHEAESADPDQSSSATTSNDMPTDLIDCPVSGDRVSVEKYCKSICHARKDKGWCPACDPIPSDVKI